MVWQGGGSVLDGGMGATSGQVGKVLWRQSHQDLLVELTKGRGEEG